MAGQGSEQALPLIEVNNVSKRFRIHREKQRSLQDAFISVFKWQSTPKDYFWPLRDVSLQVNPGDSVGILGPNGSGKSTMLKLITGILEPTSGTITVRGKVASLLELGAGFHPDLTGRENIFLNGSVYGFKRRDMLERLDDIIEFAELGDFIDTPVKHYSSGMYVRLGFSVAIHTDPDVLVVDEVLTVGDQVFQQKCLERIYALKRRGVGIVLVSHSLHDVERLCDRAIWLDNGYVREDGDSNVVVDKYLSFSNDRYYQMRNRQETEVVAEEFQIQNNARRWGTGHAIITHVDVLDESDSAPEYFVTGDQMRLRIHYKTRERIDVPTFGLAIYQRDGTHVNGPNSVQAGYHLASIDGVGVMEYTVDSLPLNPGHYELTVAIYNQDSTVAYDHHHRMYPFEVRSATLRHEGGVVHIPATWHHVAYGHLPDAADRPAEPVMGPAANELPLSLDASNGGGEFGDPSP